MLAFLDQLVQDCGTDAHFKDILVKNTRVHQVQGGQRVEQKDKVLILKLYYARNRVTVRRQYYTYTLEHLIADLGGCLGLLLGYSLLGFYDTCVSLSQCKSKIKCPSK